MVNNLRLQYLVLLNIGPFRGTQIIDMTTDKNIPGYAFFADNGRGKTSIYNAMRWCLFGEVKTRVRAGSGTKIKPKIRPITGEEDDEPLLNSSAYEEDDIPEMSVMLMAEGVQGQIQVTRDVKVYRAGKRRDDTTKETLVVKLGNETANGKDAEEMIEKFFPSTLQQFFFIDGEALEEYQSMIEKDDIQGLKDDVEAVLRLPSMTRGLDDLVAIKRTVMGKIEAVNRQKDQAIKSRDAAEVFRIEMEEAQREVEHFEQKISKLERKLNIIDSEIGDHGEMVAIVGQKASLDGRLKAAKVTLERTAENRVKMATESWKLLIWKQAQSLFEDCEAQIDVVNQADWEIKSVEADIERLKEEYERMDEVCTKCGQKIPDIKKHMEKINFPVVVQFLFFLYQL